MNMRLDITPSGYFLTTPAAVGTTDEEALAFAANQVPLERARQLAYSMRHALEMLQLAAPAGSA